jgi:transposase
VRALTLKIFENSELKELKEKLDDVLATNNVQARLFVRKCKEFDSVTFKLGESNAQVVILKQENQELKKRIDSLEQASIAASLEAQAGGTEKDGKISSLEAEVAELKAALVEKDAKIAAQEAELSEKDAKIATQEAELSAAGKATYPNDSLAGNNARIAALEAELAEKNAKIATLEAELAAAGKATEPNGPLTEKNARIATLEAELEEAKESVVKLGEILIKTGAKTKVEIDNLKGKLNTNSQNSSSSPSKDKPDAPARKTTRQPTQNKVGGQKGHKGSRLSYDTIQEMLKSDNFENVEYKVVDKTREGFTGEPIIRYSVGVKVVTTVTEFRFSCTEDIPKELLNEVTYSDELKAFAVYLRFEGCVSLPRTAKMLNEMTHGLCTPSTATIESFCSQLAQAAVDTGAIQWMVSCLQQGPVIFIDDTTDRCAERPKLEKNELYVEGGPLETKKGKSFCISVRTYSNEDVTCIFTNAHKNAVSMYSDNVLSLFFGIMSSDFETKFVNWVGIHAFCHAHLSRDIQGLIDRAKIAGCEPAVEFGQSLHDFQRMLKEKREALEASGRELLNEDEKSELRIALKNLTLRGNAIYSALDPESDLRKKGLVLMKRLDEHGDGYLMYAFCTLAPFTNNEAERSLRTTKVSAKISGPSRSWEAQVEKGRVNSVKGTAIKQRLSVLDTFKALFAKLNPFAGIKVKSKGKQLERLIDSLKEPAPEPETEIAN